MTIPLYRDRVQPTVQYLRDLADWIENTPEVVVETINFRIFESLDTARLDVGLKGGIKPLKSVSR